MADRLHTLIEGRVQGVGFRYATCAQARALGLAGWVRNLADGRVEAVFEGPRKTLNDMLAWIHDGPRFADVQQVEATWESGEPQYDSFRLRY